jgi:hypothetical protein
MRKESGFRCGVRIAAGACFIDVTDAAGKVSVLLMLQEFGGLDKRFDRFLLQLQLIECLVTLSLTGLARHLLWFGCSIVLANPALRRIA